MIKLKVIKDKELVMKKYFKLPFTIALLGFILTGCTSTTPNNNDITTTPTIEVTIVPTETITETPTQKPSVSISDIVNSSPSVNISYEKKYKEFIETIDNKEEYIYSIAYVYDDDLPELLMKKGDEIIVYEIIDNVVTKVDKEILESEYETINSLDNQDVVYVPNDYNTFIEEISKNIKTSVSTDECTDNETPKPCD